MTAVVVLGLAQVASAATTTIGFDNLADGTNVTNQYQSQGVMASGVVAANANLLPWPAHSSPNVAYAPSGLMIFDFNPAITGNIKKVSAYVSGPPLTGIYAYDANDNLVGQAVLPPGSPANTLLTVTSSGNPIVQVEIHDGGASFAVDDLTFESGNACSSGAQLIYNSVAALPVGSFKIASKAAAQRNDLLQEVMKLQQLTNSSVFTHTISKKILAQMLVITVKSALYLKATPETKVLANLLVQLGARVASNKCLQ